MKRLPWKRSLALALALLMYLSVLPFGTLAANGPDPSPEGYPFLWLTDTEGRQVTLYPERSVDEALADPGDAVVYDKAANTLTLTGFDGSAYLLEANTMGDDFTICVRGTNTLRGIVVYGAAYGGSLTLTGDGSLTVNPDGTNYCGIDLYAEETESVLTIGSELTLTVFGQNGTEPAVNVYGSFAEEGIVLPLNAEGLAVERSRLQEKVTIVEDPNGYNPWFYLYTWNGAYYGASETYMSATHAFYYTMYLLAGDPWKGFTAYEEIAEEKNLTAVPDKYEPVFGRESNFLLTDTAGTELGVVSILPGGEIGELTRPTLQITVEDGMVGKPFTGKLTAAPANGGTIRYQLVNAPDWLELDAASGALSGTPDKAAASPLIATATETVRGQSVTSAAAAKTLRIDAPVVTFRLAEALTDGLDRTLRLSQGGEITEIPLGTGDLAAGALYKTAQLKGGADCTVTLTGTLHGVEHVYGSATFAVPAGENYEYTLTGLAQPTLRHIVPTVQSSEGQPVESYLRQLEWYDGADPETAQLLSLANEYVCLPAEAVWVRAVPSRFGMLQVTGSPLVAASSGSPVLTMALIPRADVSGVVLLEGEDTPVDRASIAVSVGGMSAGGGYTNSSGAFSLKDAPITEDTVLTVTASEIEPLTVPLSEVPEGPLTLRVQRRAGRITFPAGTYPNSGWAETEDGEQRFSLQFQGSTAACLTESDKLKPGQTLRLHLFDSSLYVVGTVTLDEHLQGAMALTEQWYLGSVQLSPENPGGLVCQALLYNAEGKLIRQTASNDSVFYLHSLLEGDYTVLFTAKRTYNIVGEAAFDTLDAAKSALDAAGENLYTTAEFHVAYSATPEMQQLSGILPTGSVTQNTQFIADACGLTVEADDSTVNVRATLMPKNDTTKKTVTLQLLTNQVSDSNGRTPDLVNGSLYINGKRVAANDQSVTFYPSEKDHAVYFTGNYSLRIDDVSAFGGWPLTVQWQTYRTDFDHVSATLLASAEYYWQTVEPSYIAYENLTTPVLRLVAPTLIAKDVFSVYGYAPKGAPVTVFLDGAEAAQTTADARTGFYTAELKLDDPYGAETHTVSAASEKNGQPIRSGQAEVRYRSNTAYLTEISTFDYVNKKVPLWKDGASSTGYYYYLPSRPRPFELVFGNCDGPEALEKVVVHVPCTDGEVLLEAHWVSGGTWQTEPYSSGNNPPNGAWVEYVPAWQGYELTENDFAALDRAVEADRADWAATVDGIRTFLGDEDATEYVFEEADSTPKRDGDADSALSGLRVKWSNGSTDLRELSFKMDGVRYTIRTDNVTNMTITYNKNKELKALFAQFEGKTEEERRNLPLFADAGDDVFYPFESDDSYQRVGMQDGVLTCVSISRAGDKDLNTLWRVTTITPGRYTEEVYNTQNASVATLVYERETPFEIDLNDYYDPAWNVAEGEKQPWDNDVNRGLILQTLWIGAFYDMDAIAKGEKTGTWADLTDYKAPGKTASRPTLPNGVKVSKNAGTAFYQLMAACLIQNGVERGAAQGIGRDAEVWTAFDVARKANGGGVYNNIKWKLGRELLSELKGTLDTSVSVGGNVTTLLTEGTEAAIYEYMKGKIEDAYYGDHVNPFNPTAKSKSAQKKVDEMGQVWDGVDAIFRDLESRGFKIDRSLMPPDPRLTKEDFDKSQGKTDSNKPGGGGGSTGGEEQPPENPGQTDPGGGSTEPPTTPSNPPAPGAEQTPVPDSVKPAMDPSGYVYEGVPSNRVAGVTATIYEVADDGTTTRWDAEEYGQTNPYVTEENGFYEWMVPQGKWSVRFTADGYAPYVTGEHDGVGTAQAGDTWYMPVAPVQLDVNVNLQRLDAPEVVAAIPTTEGVRVVFSQYMRASLLTADRFSLLINSLPVPLTDSDLRLIDGEENNGVLYARELLVACAPEPGDLVSLTVDDAAESYTGKPLAKTFVLADAPVQTLPQAAAPQITPNGGTAAIGSSVEITAGSDARIYYTTDGTAPTRESTLYTGPIVLGGDTTLRAIAVEPGKRESAVTEAAFTTAQTYQITVLTDGHGSVTLDKTRAAAGETVRLTATPNGGYELGSVTLRPQAISVSGDTFTMPEGEVTVVVKFRDTVTDEPIVTRFTVTFDANGHGEAPAAQSVEAGLRAEKPTDPTAEGWVFGGWYTEAACVNFYDFTAPVTADLTLYAKWTKQAAQENPFEDVLAGKFYYDAVLWAVAHDPQITNGIDATHFAPDTICTRGQVVTFLWRAAGCPAPGTETNPFTDVQTGSFYYKAVLWAVEQKITNGTSATTFGPRDTCTRGHVVTFLWRAKGSPAPTGTETAFTDVNPGAFYYKAMLWAVENGVTTGMSATSFAPFNGCTRGQVVTFLYRDLG